MVMNILTIFFIIIYSVCSLSIFFFSLIHLELYFNYKKRIGKSKISGTLKGSILAGQKILYLIFKYYLKKKVDL